ncbi:DUF2840 domain-containing protein [Agrobacterium tumefaciens]|uniref:DUF2840 domain-containing protein n=1 Tax=Agrobacterium tumefaciens TaxID=358 RepID=UPI001295DC36|nr:DUF2840 domain-containing protein [Agrobacterium tumefaciens]MCW8059261.1 DUF2840 domain-containing protein [Agrobacterium tumefaciens]MCW8147165.1 DUF2840 domain-containing protein [Agrobacterium tumefaciens]MQB37438.1 DUF2840 domain-containing protein [Agrobacterium tumefaciens]
MTNNAALRMRGHPLPDGPAPFLTLVELTWVEKRIENWIRFGRASYDQKLDNHKRLVGFSPEMIFCLVRWAANEHGTIISRVDIVRAVDCGEPFQTLPFVRPGGEMLLKIGGWPKVERVLRIIDAIEAQGVEPAEVSPDHWRHVHNRMTADAEPRAYGASQHKAFLLRRKVEP